MLDAIKRILSPEYLIVAEPGLPAGLWVLYGTLAVLFAAGIAAALTLLITFRQRDERSPGSAPGWAWFMFWVSLAGLGTVLGRFLGWPGWSARIWPFSFALLALAGAMGYRFRAWTPPNWLWSLLRILSLDPDEPLAQEVSVRRIATFVAGAAIHLLGIALVVHVRYRLELWAVPLVLVAVLAPQWPILARKRLPRLAALTPLFGAYGVALLTWAYRALGITIIGWQGLEFPNPLVSLFYLDGVVLASVTYAFLCQLRVTARSMQRPSIMWKWPVLGMLAITVGWASIIYLSKRTHGATASDPYAYAQMGVDLAERGTFLHRYTLFQDVIPLGIAWAPLQPVGYHIPRNVLGDCPSVWATGASVLLAAGYGILGEAGLYVTTPALGLLALAATWALAQEALHGESRPVRYTAGAIAVALLATSAEQVDRLLVPMADAAAQLFTILTLLLVLRASRLLSQAPLRTAGRLVLTGICFAWAYWARHTQLVLALPILVSLGLTAWKTPVSRSRVFLSIALVFGAAVLAALPDILYRWNVFGGVFATETTELPSMALAHVGPVAWQLLRDTLVAGEWGYLFPLALYGAWRLSKQEPRTMLTVGTAFAAVLAVHLTYRFLRLRDLLSLFPMVALFAGYGAVAMYRDLRMLKRKPGSARRLGSVLLPVGAVAWILLSLALSRWAIIDRLWKPGWASFGYMEPRQRAAFDELAELTPPKSVIGASLNAGAIMLYSGRDAVRPYDSWTEAEWSIFLGAMHDLGRPVFLLDDGGLMSDFIKLQSDRHPVHAVAELEVPMFSANGRSSGWLYRVERAP